jgi:hypothetical protein
MEAAEASLKSAEASVELIKAQIAKTEVRAPFAGKLGFVNVSVGAWLTTGTSIATLSEVKKLKAKFALPQRYATTLKVGDAVDVKDEERNMAKSGKVKALEASLSESSRTRQVLVEIDNANGDLLAGSYAKVTLTDAEVIGKSADGYSTVWIQDATGGCWIQYTSLNGQLNELTKINGTVYVVKRLTSGNPQMKEAEDTPKSEIAATAISNYTTVEGTLAEVNVAANLNKVVKLTGTTIEETSASAGKLTQGESTIDLNNGTATANQQLYKIADWEKDKKLENVTIVAILVAKSATVNQLLPISVKVEEVTGIASVAENRNEKADIFNVQGVRLNKVQKGINIVNGKKVMMK